MSYNVQQLADIAGVSVRTLHHYDEIGLLSPQRESNGYRVYEEAELLRLQQILFFRELELPLEEIAAILKKPDFHLVGALHEHRKQMQKKQERLKNLITTIDNTLAKLSGKKEMSDDALFEAFWEKHVNEYAPEAEARWGHTDAWKQSKERTKHMTKEDFKCLAKDGEKWTADFAKLSEKFSPESPEIQEKMAEHYNALRTFYEPNHELYRGLGDMYVDDPRFTAYYDKHRPGLAKFMRDAMHAYCDKQKS